jgi:hypothetical protein
VLEQVMRARVLKRTRPAAERGRQTALGITSRSPYERMAICPYLW